ncbi:hypothetical protein [Thalassotalea aquiviva]|uniref:hypothetical protein n=1 Tax=Thalassotalea aquiviva TaxID=3242415 RepID=UPI00352BC0CB
MNKLLPFILILLSGCSSTYMVDYKYSHKVDSDPIRIAQSIPFIVVDDFKYNQHRNLTSYELSALGCGLCEDDGSTSWGLVFKQPISSIIRQEVEMALTEISIGGPSQECMISANIHQAAHDTISTDQSLDITYSLHISNDVQFSKRIKSKTDNKIFSLLPIERLLAKVTRQSVQDLVLDRNFLKTIRQNCS